MPEVTLLPCPACGNPDAVVSVTTRAAVYCPMCGMCGPWLPKGRYGICCQTMERSSSRHNEAPKDKIMRAINPLYSDSQKCLLHHPAEGIARD